MKRLEGIRNQFTVEKIDALIVESDANRRYLSGFTGSAGVIFITSDQAYFITDFRYVEQAKNQCEGFTIVEHKGSISNELKALVEEHSITSVGFEKSYTTFEKYEVYKDTGIPLIPVAGLVESLRMFKDEKELSIMKEAAEIADQAFYDIVDYIKPGMKETEVRDRLEFTMRRLGADRSSFEIIVASGSRGALPHGVASDKVIEEGEFVTMDFGAYYKGYCSDITRTVAVGQPTDEMKKVYETVLEAQLLGVEQIKPGMTGKEADQICRDYIYSKGYEGKFGHGLGHGLGMEVHEGPGVSPKGNVVLKPGMVVTVEPGVYLPGVGGVRIEDDIVITADGNERLTTSDKSLRHIGK
ncbi:Xaa-Pro peptidase family protein [Geomicrobium sp. JCM 19039]|uniref:M24 family metallopeptidase n=1 Tax=Geomicrobium sp. JCM 19039 TaxID=1460636 RepID=UPI00045F1908|nr:Xaa-Pro peptidase family protein [Geomicrobium sp. JCM 19039]GAK12789.1 aminopeptidase YpdF [Geomicrobium sp. JCM 19039]